MINSLILMFSQYNKNGKLANIFKCFWVFGALVVSLINFNFAFLPIELFAFLLTTCFIQFLNRFGSKVNVLMSVLSTLIYSLIVDVVCYFALPVWCGNQSLVQYVINGLIFNSRYVILNIGVIAIVTLCFKSFKKLSKTASI